MIGKRLVHRSWGWYFVLLDRKHFKVKLLRFNAKKSLSWQYHKLRNELWLFLSGEGSLKLGEYEAQRVGAGDFKIVNVGTGHQYMPWKKTIVLEIQYGEKCEESDIVRI